MITPPQIAKRLSVYFRNITKFELIFHGGEPSEIWSQETNVWMLKFKETDYIEIINHLIYVWTLLDYAYLFLEWINVWGIICITKWLSFPVDSHQTMRNGCYLEFYLIEWFAIEPTTCWSSICSIFCSICFIYNRIHVTTTCICFWILYNLRNSDRFKFRFKFKSQN